MYYAHTGAATDNAITVMPNGRPSRTFLHFETAEARAAKRNEVWEKSERETNLIDCDPKLVRSYLGGHYNAPDGVVYASRLDYELDYDLL